MNLPTALFTPFPQFSKFRINIPSRQITQNWHFGGISDFRWIFLRGRSHKNSILMNLPTALFTPFHPCRWISNMCTESNSKQLFSGHSDWFFGFVENRILNNFFPFSDKLFQYRPVTQVRGLGARGRDVRILILLSGILVLWITKQYAVYIFWDATYTM